GAPQLMVDISVHADDVEVFEFPSDESEIISPQYITVEVRATIITLRNGGLYVAACEVQLEVSSGGGGCNTGAIVGSVVGVGVVICITILVTGLLIRSRRLPRPTLELGETQRNSVAEEENSATECRGDLEVTDELPSGGQGDGPHNYDKLASYENSDDIKPYTSLQTKQPSPHGPQDADTMTASYANVYVTTGNQYENIRNVDI
ncbi:hypothetical protein BaRGS_00019106, partial [Batillaria attramentaria]